MKKKYLTAFFILVALAGSVFAATTGTVDLTGTVTQVLNVSVANPTVSFTFNTAGASVPLGNVTLKSNMKSWAVKVWSTNGSMLKNANTPTPDEIAYAFSMGSLFSGITLIAGNTAPLSSQEGYLSMTGKTAASGSVLAMSVTYGAEGSVLWTSDAGFYTDTIHIEIAAN